MKTPTRAPRKKKPEPQAAASLIQSGPIEAKPNPRVLLYAVEGWGKTTLASQTPNPVILMTRDDGYESLLKAKRVPAIDRAKIEDWETALQVLGQLEDSDYETVVIDSLGGLERMCHDHVCDKEFDGDWSERGFASFNRGYETSLHYWKVLLEHLDKLHAGGKIILLLGHAEIKPFNNPQGADFDQFVPQMHKKTVTITRPWVDEVWFGNLVSVPRKEGGKIKGFGQGARVLITAPSDAVIAKSRAGITREIAMPDSPEDLWSRVWECFS